MKFYSFCERKSRGVAFIVAGGLCQQGLPLPRGPPGPAEKGKRARVVCCRSQTCLDLERACADSLLEAFKIIKNSSALTAECSLVTFSGYVNSVVRVFRGELEVL